MEVSKCVISKMEVSKYIRMEEGGIQIFNILQNGTGRSHRQLSELYLDTNPS